MGFLFMDNAILFTWKRREEGASAEGDLKQCSLSSWIVHCDGEGKKMRYKWGKNVLWETRWRWLWVQCQRWGWQISATMCLKKCMYVHKCAFNTKKYVPVETCDVTCFGQWDCDFQTCFMENFPHSHSREVKVTIMALHYIPLQLQWELITLSFNYVKVVVLHFQKFFSWSFILSVYCLMSRLMVVSSSSSVNQFSTSPDLAIMIYHNHKRNLRWNSVVKSQYLLKDYGAKVSKTPA